MQDYIKIDLSSGIGLQRANVYGTLELNQKSALRTRYKIKRLSEMLTVLTLVHQ